MSEERDPRVVHVAPDLRIASTVAAWFGEKGYLCEVVVPEHPAEAPDGIGLTAHAPPGVEVRVLDVDQAQKAKDLLADAFAARELAERRAARTGTVSATCEECGTASEWAAADMGSTQECPSCGRYMDVPDPDDDWSDVDFGSEDDAAPPADPKAEG
ncbi:hypothetical protein [Urbifossiella limnaea]|uniref:DUF2007 domain-containing protein n=1 Tax=Urbifossiella limnaea TaxID=2528023 RepID=A0A517XLM7_9BACT|nr:hypothetical protein [Urbifossiella limnaea]QDU18413.1 hypothetical protein ETAA1_02990 [Urbifossiella limnaea]